MIQALQKMKELEIRKEEHEIMTTNISIWTLRQKHITQYGKIRFSPSGPQMSATQITISPCLLMNNYGIMYF